MSTSDNSPRGCAARHEAERLIALAADLLDNKQDQIARDHLGLALDALDHSQFGRHDASAGQESSLIRGRRA